MEHKPRIGIIMGDAAGIGPEIIIKTLSQGVWFDLCEPFIFGSPSVMVEAAALLGSSLRVEASGVGTPISCSPGVLHVIDCNVVENQVQWGVVSAENGKNCINAFAVAVRAVLEGRLDAITFGPLNKESLHMAGMLHPDEAGLLGELSNVPLVKSVVKWNSLFRSTVVGHVPFSRIIESLNTEKVLLAIEHVGMVMDKFLQHKPRIGVASLNPHAGEGGDMGDEERLIIVPAINEGRLRFGHQIAGPYPADTILLKALRGEIDGIVYLYHDQGNIAMKAVGFGKGVVIYSGMPFFATTPAHGTAHAIAGTGVADASNFMEALRVSIQLTVKREEHVS